MIAFFGYDGFMYSVGFLVAYLTVLFIVAEPLRNAGKYTMADLLAYRLKARPVRAAASLSTLTVSTFYMVAQMIGAGVLVSTLLKDYSWITPNSAIAGVGVLMIVYVVFGGMHGTTWVQIIKAILLMSATFVLSFLVMKQFDFSFTKFFDAIAHLTYTDAKGNEVTRNFLDPGWKFGAEATAKTGGWGPLDLFSLGLALVLGTAGLPHVLVRFYTVPDAKTARVSVVWAMVIIGVFYILTTFLGFGAATLLKPHNIANENMAAPELSHFLGGDIFFAFISAVAFATILAVVAGLTLSGASAVSHDLFASVFRKSAADSKTELRVSKITTVVLGVVAIALGIAFEKQNVAFMVSLAFALAASGNFPVLILALLWKGCTTRGAVVGGSLGVLTAVVLMVLSPSIWVAVLHHEAPIFPYTSPALFSMAVAFITTWLVSITDTSARGKLDRGGFDDQRVRSETGIGAHRASEY
jgi:cation/acetate symporter